MAQTPDPVADTLADNAHPASVVTFCGFVGDGTAGTDTFRLYTDPWLVEWLEIDNDDLRYRVPAATPGAKSVIWVAANAKITKCESGTAQYFAEEALRAHDDPAASARDRKPP